MRVMSKVLEAEKANRLKCQTRSGKQDPDLAAAENFALMRQSRPSTNVRAPTSKRGRQIRLIEMKGRQTAETSVLAA